MRRATLEPGHPHIAVNINNLANLYREQGDYVRDEPLYREAIAITRESAGEEHPWTSGMIGNLGVMYLRAGNAKGAAEAFREALRIRQRSEEHTSELQSLMRITSAVFCLIKK